MEKTCPRNMSLEDWYALNAKWCDEAHQRVYSCPREKPDENGVYPECTHRHPWLEVQVEVSAACNAKCVFCPYPSPVNAHRRGKFMEPALFRKIADEVETIDLVGQMSFNGLGEPLLDPDIYDKIAYMHAKRPYIRLLLHTNGVYLTDPQRLHDTGLTNLVVSVNAVNAEQHERLMKLKGKYELVCDNLRRARSLPGWIVSARACYSGDNFTKDDVKKFTDQWGERYAIDTIFATETNWIDQNRTIQRTEWGDEGCFRALSQIYINYNGDVGMCCMDAFIKKNFGSVRRQTIREIYNSDKYVQFRLAHAENRALSVPECTGCTR
jgi:radical SAM protein with 4Fe4S-binding SPASM domain